MRSTGAVALSAAAAVLLSAPTGRWGWDRLALAGNDGRAVTPVVNELAPGRTESARALREAGWEWIEARRVVSRELEARLAGESEGVLCPSTDAVRGRLAEMDVGGHLRRARTATMRAQALARTPAATFRAVLLLARVECDAGHHSAELRLAWRLMKLRPRDSGAWAALQHAAVCNGLASEQRHGATPSATAR